MNNSTTSPRHLDHSTRAFRNDLSIALLSAALIGFELVLLQVFSIMQWHHFAFMVISVALLGFGASGTLLSIWRERLIPLMETIVPLLMILSGLSITAAVPLCQLDVIRFDSYRIFLEWKQVASLMLSYLVLFAPFFLGATAIGMLFVSGVQKIGRMYFANLAGSGLGTIAVLSLMWLFSPSQLPSFCSLLAVLAALVAMKKPSLFFSISAATVMALAVLHLVKSPTLIPSEYKSISRTLNVPEATIILEKPSPYGYLQVVTAPALRYAPGLSLAFAGEVPRQAAVFNNGDWTGTVMEWSRRDTSHILDNTTLSLPFVLQKRSRVLVVKAGTIYGVQHAYTKRPVSITAVEPDGALISLLQNELAQDTDSIFLEPRINLRHSEARSFIASDTTRYDLIVLPTPDAFGGTGGITALQEQHILTREAFRDLWNHLSPSGVLCVTAWMDYPPRNSLKLLATLVEMLQEESVEDPRMRLVAVRSWATVTFLAKREVLLDSEIAATRQFCSRMSFDPLLLPDIVPEERMRHNRLREPLFFSLVDSVLSPVHRERLYDEYDFDVRPATDGRPYFSQFLKWQAVPRLQELFGEQIMPFLEVGSMIALVTLVQVCFAAVTLIISPLFFLRGSPRKLWTMLYFGCLGLGYMFVEIVLIQRFVLYFGQTVFAAAAVISTMLVCSGIGSAVSQHFEHPGEKLVVITLIITVLIILLSLICTPLLNATIGFSFIVKVLLTFALIAPPAFIMGMAFPIGLRHLSQHATAEIPWAWGINGSLSVVSTVLATLVALKLGFDLVLLGAAGIYGAAALVSIGQKRN